MKRKDTSSLSDEEIAAAFENPIWADLFPPILTIKKASHLLDVPLGTLRDWRVRGLLNSCSRRRGRHLRFWRDGLIKWFFSERNDGTLRRSRNDEDDVHV